MEKYVRTLQKKSGWVNILKPVFKCCIKNDSKTGFCEVCLENFKYRNGEYYEGFDEYKDDGDLLKRLETSLKPLGTFVFQPEDEGEIKDFEDEVEDRGLIIVDKFEKSYGLILINVMKNKDLEAKDVVNLELLSELLEMTIPNVKISEISEEPILVYQAIRYGYPFYTLTIDRYLEV